MKVFIFWILRSGSWRLRAPVGGWGEGSGVEGEGLKCTAALQRPSAAAAVLLVKWRVGGWGGRGAEGKWGEGGEGGKGHRPTPPTIAVITVQSFAVITVQSFETFVPPPWSFFQLMSGIHI